MCSSSAAGKPSLIEFPADLTVTAMGINTADFKSVVLAIAEPLILPAQPGEISSRESSQGKYLSVRVHFRAVSLSQLHAIYSALRAHERVLYVL